MSSFKTYSFLPLSHILAKAVDVVGSFLHGGHTYFGGKDAVPKFGEYMKKIRPHFIYSVPRVYEKIMGRFYDSLSKMNFMRN